MQHAGRLRFKDDMEKATRGLTIRRGIESNLHSLRNYLDTSVVARVDFPRFAGSDYHETHFSRVLLLILTSNLYVALESPPLKGLSKINHERSLTPTRRK